MCRNTCYWHFFIWGDDMQYDGTIRIATKITTKDATESLASLEWQIKKSAKYMDELRSKMDALKDQKIPTKEYKKLQEELSEAEKTLSALIKEQSEMEDLGITSGSVWDTLNEKVATASDSVDLVKAKMQALVDAGKGFTLGKDTEQYASMERQLQYEEEAVRKAAEHYKKLLRTSNAYKKMGDIAKKSLVSIGNMLKKVNATINSFGKRIKETFSKFAKSSSDATKSANKFSLSLKNILKYGFGIRSLYALINKIRSAIKDGFTNLYNDRDMEYFRNSIDNLKASALTLKNAFAAAFSPFVEIALPYVQKLLDYMTQLLNIAGQFFAAITGRKTYIKAIKQTTDALKEETKEMNKQLSPLDKLNNLSSQKDKGKDDSTGGTMFEEVPIAKSILDMAEKVKDILSKLFAPLKEAWEREGKFVMDSWKYALDEVWKLIKDIGRDFLEVWQQEKTVKIFEDLLHIIGDIGLIVGHLARNFRDAWNENKTGLHILENIRDIIGVIVHNIRLAADKTVEWADKLNFKPLLEAFERFTKSLIPLADALSGILADFYTKVLLPLATWTIEKGLPELLDVFTAFNEKVDWQALRNNLAEFWEHLEPFAETIGEGLIIFIQRVSDALADFLNSQEFKDFLVMIENWMDSVSPEDVADALEMIAKGLIALKLAVLGFGAISAVAGTFTTLSTFFSAIGSLGGLVAKDAALIATGIGNIVAAIGGLLPALAAVAAAVIGWKIGEWINEKLLGVDTPSFYEIMNGIKSSFTDGSWKQALVLWGKDILASFKNVWKTAEMGWKNQWDFVKRGWKQTVEWIKETIRTLQNTFRNIGTGLAGSKLFGSSSSRAGGASRMAIASPYSANPAFSALSNAEIPAIATGQAVPTSMKQHFVASESNSRETGIASLASAIEEASVNAMTKINGGSGSNNSNNSGGNNVYEFSVDGMVFFRIMQKYAEEYKKQNGGKIAFS